MDTETNNAIACPSGATNTSAMSNDAIESDPPQVMPVPTIRKVELSTPSPQEISKNNKEPKISDLRVSDNNNNLVMIDQDELIALRKKLEEKEIRLRQLENTVSAQCKDINQLSDQLKASNMYQQELKVIVTILSSVDRVSADQDSDNEDQDSVDQDSVDQDNVDQDSVDRDSADRVHHFAKISEQGNTITEFEIHDTTLLPSAIGELRNLTLLNIPNSSISSLPHSIGRLTNLSHLDLSSSKNLTNLPQEIGDLVNLTCIKLSSSSIRSLPSSIQKLKNLEKLVLSFTKKLKELPKEIGDLANLKVLRLCGSSVSSIPPSIVELKNLESLDLSYTENLKELPENIGTLANLKELFLEYTNIISLPSSIKKLKNLEKLDLSGTKKMAELPEVIGDLVNLKELLLDYGSISSLPSSIGKLHCLEELYLGSTKSLSKLPEEIGNLANLKVLDLSESSIVLLPDSLAKLSNLMQLQLDDTTISNVQDPNDPTSFIWMLLKANPLLGQFGHDVEENATEELSHALSINRARFRMGFRGSNQPIPKLWPLILGEAVPRASDVYPYVCGVYDRQFECRPISRVDGIYQLLKLGRESFIKLLMDRNVE